MVDVLKKIDELMKVLSDAGFISKCNVESGNYGRDVRISLDAHKFELNFDPSKLPKEQHPTNGTSA